VDGLFFGESAQIYHSLNMFPEIVDNYFSCMEKRKMMISHFNIIFFRSCEMFFRKIAKIRDGA